MKFGGHTGYRLRLPHKLVCIALLFVRCLRYRDFNNSSLLSSWTAVYTVFRLMTS